MINLAKNVWFFISLGLVFVVLRQCQDNKEIITKIETKTVIDTIFKVDTITKIITKPYQITNTVVNTDTFYKNNCDSTRNYTLVHNDSNLKFKSNLLVIGYLKDHTFEYTVFPKTTTINSVTTNTITRTIIPKHNLFLSGGVVLNNPSINVGLIYQNKKILYLGNYNLNNGDIQIGLGHRIF
jgi:hypothetical protein